MNHPHIAAIYGFEDRDGLHALVLELVEGETLAEMLARAAPPSAVRHQPSQGLPIGDALSIAHQVADALEAAHEKGIIHRDLKPANVMVTTDSRVKVLDFGIGKAIEPAEAAPSDPTVEMTRDGIMIADARIEITGPPTAVIEGIMIAAGWIPMVAVGANGSLAYATGRATSAEYQPRTLVWVDRSGREELVDAPARAWAWPQISPDGMRLGLHIHDPVNMDAWIYELDHGPLVRMTYDPAQDGYPVWTPDGTRIAFWSKQPDESLFAFRRPHWTRGTVDDERQRSTAVLVGA